MPVDSCVRCEHTIDIDDFPDSYQTLAGELICVHFECLTEEEQNKIEREEEDV